MAAAIRPFAVLLVDLDGFKAVNDHLGHAAGDAVLREVAARLQRAVRESDTVARLGGDEFALVLPHADEGGAVDVASRIILSLATPIILPEQAVSVGASSGIAIWPQHGEDGKHLLRCADRAMYQAKAGGGGYRVYTKLRSTG